MNRFPLDEEGRCALCRTDARGFDAAYCFGFYEGPLRGLVHLLKYSGMKPLAKPLGEYLSRALPLDEPFDVVVPMPLHWRRRLQRGFNQAALLAAEIARRRRLPVANAVRRVRATESQIGLTNSKRRLNVRGAFRARGSAIVGRRVLLIDDVMTTGATASACAAALKRAGAKSVTLLTVARVDRRFTPFTPSAFASSSGEPPSSGAPTEAAPDRESTALWQTTGAS